ncbi:hypothetical protein V6N11_017316 [Hibiscus sabdariffa]|uniref:DUF4283 domain-containing protein n=1 Tax=Hibiscus sabdariffa TaxID=183260 RepID=A0ABR2TXX7_9ROSI
MENLLPSPRKSRKHRWLDDGSPDGGGPDDGSDIPVPPEAVSKKTIPSIPSYKDSLMKDSSSLPSEIDKCIDEDDIEFEEREVVRSTIDGLISIDFFDRILSLAKKSLDQTVAVKLLGCRIGYTTLRNKIYELRKPSQPIKLMDIENDYFLVTFRIRSDYLKVLSDGSWTIFGHYLTVES